MAPHEKDTLGIANIIGDKREQVLALAAVSKKRGMGRAEELACT